MQSIFEFAINALPIYVTLHGPLVHYRTRIGFSFLVPYLLVDAALTHLVHWKTYNTSIKIIINLC